MNKSYLNTKNKTPKPVVEVNDLKVQFQLKKTWKKFLPAAFGGGILQINLLVDTILASLLGFGSISYLYFADV